MIDKKYNAPKFSFAVSEEVKALCPLTVEEDKVKKQLNWEDFLPTRAEPKATGLDVRCAEPNGMILKPGCYFMMKLGFRIFAPDGWWMLLSPRSSSFLKKNINPLYGVLDTLYEGDVRFVGQYIPDECKLINPNEDMVIPFGARIAQLIPFKNFDIDTEAVSNEEYNEMCKERGGARGAGGFGSTKSI